VITKLTAFLVLLIWLITSFATAQDNFYSRSKTSFIQPEYPIPGFHPAHKSEELDTPNLLSPILPDFQVNENEGPFGAFQEVPFISMALNGNFIVAWFDFRNGGKGDIFAQRYARDASPIGSNFQVNDWTEVTVQFPFVSIGIDANDNFMIAWEDERNGEVDIYAQLFTAAGNASGENFKVNDAERTGKQSLPSVIAAGNGNFVIAWMSDLNYNPDIYAQRYTNNGTALGSNFKVNDDAGMAIQGSPSLASDSNGNFLITWQDNRNGHSDIYAQRYSHNGSAVEKNFKINDDTGSKNQRNPVISVLDDNKFVIFWQDDREGMNAFYAQLLTGDGTRSGKNFKIQCDNVVPFLPFQVSIQKNGNFLLTWADMQEAGYPIYAQRIFHDGTALGNAFIVADVPQIGFIMTSPVIASDSSGRFTIVWADSRNGEYDIYAQQFSETGIAEGNNLKINDDQGSASQLNSAVATDGNGNFIVTWKDYRNGTIDVYSQRFSHNGTALGDNFKVNNFTGSTFEFPPAVALDESGNFVITWEDTSHHNFDILAQRYSSDGTALLSNVKVNDDLENAGQFDPAITSDAYGNFVIIWLDGRNGHNKDVYAQRFSSDGTTLGKNFKVNDDVGNPAQFHPAISSDPAGNFVVTWQDNRNGFNADIYAQRYSSDGTALASNFIINDDVNASQSSPVISMDTEGNFVIAWCDNRKTNSDIYAQRFADTGTALGNNFKVNDDVEHTGKLYPTISMNESGNYIIAWRDYRNGTADIYAQRYLSDGTKLGENFRMTNTGEFNQSEPAVQMWRNRIYTTWTDNRAGGTGIDIWANILDWENPTEIVPETPTSSPASFLICQNYPNPFNPETSIVYELPAAGEVKIEVFDIRGRLVNTLINGQIPAGTQRVRWNGLNESGQPVASGVYYYRINYASARECRTTVRKMTLIR